MAAAGDAKRSTNKRKRVDDAKTAKPKPFTKPKAKPEPKGADSTKKMFKSSDQPTNNNDSKPNKSAKDRRLAAKEVVESRKKKRKPNYNLEKELASLWEKMRSHSISKEERSKLVSEALRKMNGKFLEIAGSHVLARVLQTCVKHCSQAERESIFTTLKPNLLDLSRKKYAVHLVKKLLECATKKQLDWFISSLHGHVVPLLRHTVGSTVIDYAFHLANGAQKQSLLVEMYSTEFQLFKDLTLTNSGRLTDIISKLGLQKSLVLHHMTSAIQPLLEKGIVNHAIIHKALVEYFTIADKTSAADVIQQLLPLLVQESVGIEDNQNISAPELPKKRKIRKLKEPLLVQMMRTRDGLKVCILCIKHSNARERKKLLKGLKGYIGKLSMDQYGSILLACILSVVDDTTQLSKIIIRELQTILKEIPLDKNGRRVVLQLLHPNCPRYFAQEDLACLDLSVPSLSAEAKESETMTEVGQEGHSDIHDEKDNDGTSSNSRQAAANGKKDQFLRRHELLVESGLAESLFNVCIENIGELLRAQFGKDVIYELAIGGTGNVLQSLASRIDDLHKAIASLAALAKTDDLFEEHVLENFHSSRLIRKLVLDSPKFASTLWEMALKGKCNKWAEGHSGKVVLAFLESSESETRELAKSELQPLLDSGIIKVPDRKQTEKEG